MKTIYNQISTKELVIIDPRVEAYQILTKGVGAGAKVIIIDPNFDGIEQITEALAEYPANSLHIICHGAPGCLYLGKTPINAANIQQYRQQLPQWQVSDILLYACNVAADTFLKKPKKPGFSKKPGFWQPEDPDATFLYQLHHLTGANIAASAHPVGNESKGGTWNLQYQLGNISSPIAFSPKVCSSYPGIFPASFATPTNFSVGNTPISVTTGDFNGDGKLDIAAANRNSYNVSVLLGTGTGSFAAATNFAVGTAPVSVTTGDFNGDGKL
ncbi:MAG: DUF4347 domain-containing protein, partial [Phormidium sp.]